MILLRWRNALMSGTSIALAMLAPTWAAAQDGAAAQAPAPTASAPAVAGHSDLVVTGRRLNAARATIQPQVGASTYKFDSKAIEALPAGDNTALNQVVLQAPGVAQDSYGQLHVRGEHNGLQYRLNGVILPEGLSVFGQSLSPRLADSIQLITGALPAEYGLHTAGIVDITTKAGYQDGGSVSIYGGSQRHIEPSAEYGGSSGDTNYFVSLSSVEDDLGIESPDGRADPIHDHTSQLQGFAYVDQILNPDNRVSLIVGSSNERFQIPDVSGQMNGGLNLNVNGQTRYPSQDLNESQKEATQYAVVSLLNTTGPFTSQISLFARYSTLSFSPDELGDLIYNGISQAAEKTDSAGGLQAETAYKLNDQHTIRAGVIVEIDRSTSATTSQVLLINNNAASGGYGQEISNQPYTIVDNGSATAHTYSVYLQDEYKILSHVTLNYGLRFDDFEGYRDQNQVSPRANLVWQATPSTTFHAGYARYFSPPPFELVNSNSVSKFTTPTGNPLVTSSANPLVSSSGLLVANAANPLVTADTTPYAERANYYDVGAAQKIGRHFSVTLDAFYKTSTDLIDEGQFGAPIILTPFNYAKGLQYGLELTLSYASGPFSAYANVSHVRATGLDWTTSQFSFPQARLDYVAGHYIYLDHDENLSISAGTSYTWQGIRGSADLIYGSGLRADLPLTNTVIDGLPLNAVPNGLELPAYVQVNASLSHRFEHIPTGPLEVRFDITNLFDDAYQIRNGTGVGVFAPQYGPRRGFFVGLTKEF